MLEPQKIREWTTKINYPTDITLLAQNLNITTKAAYKLERHLYRKWKRENYQRLSRYRSPLLKRPIFSSLAKEAIEFDYNGVMITINKKTGKMTYLGYYIIGLVFVIILLSIGHYVSGTFFSIYWGRKIYKHFIKDKKC